MSFNSPFDQRLPEKTLGLSGLRGESYIHECSYLWMVPSSPRTCWLTLAHWLELLDLPIDLLSVVDRMDFSRQLACENMTCEEIEKRMDELARQYAKRTTN